MTSIQQATQLAGSLFLTGFKGLSLNALLQKQLTQLQPAGVILFSKNFENPVQLAQLSCQLQSCSQGLPFWIGVDQEGGRVQRFKQSFTRIPSAAQIAAQGNEQIAYQIAQITAKELCEVGINLNFTPVCDLRRYPNSDVLGDRAFSDSTQEVKRFSQAVFKGHHDYSVQTCVKHFPGHGLTPIDSHLQLPVLNSPPSPEDLAPFQQAIATFCSLLMMAHLKIPSLDPLHPTSLSASVIQGLLKKQLGYSGLVITDDLTMEAIRKHYSPAQAAILAIQAGCDLFIYRTLEATLEAHQGVIQEINHNPGLATHVLAAAQRIHAHKRSTLLFHPTSFRTHLDPKDLQRLQQRQTRDHEIEKLWNR